MKALIAGIALCVIVAFGLGADSCDSASQPQSVSGVGMAKAEVPTGPDHLTVEQRNTKRRLEEDNRPGAIKHLYVISAYSGQVLIYSTVDGKVTSSGKRLTPTSIVVGSSGEYKRGGFEVLGDYATSEVLQDDGTYGSSVEYVYWWDTRGIYHQHYVAGGQILHVSSEPLAVKSIVINMALSE